MLASLSLIMVSLVIVPFSWAATDLSGLVDCDGFVGAAMTDLVGVDVDAVVAARGRKALNLGGSLKEGFFLLYH